MNRLKQKYNEEVKAKLTEELGVKNSHALPKLIKVVVNMAVSEGKDNSASIEKSAANITVITGQKAMITKAKKSIAAFKLTEGAPIGVMATLRGEKMFAFLDKLINIVLPKVRDFRGVSDKSFDGQGNFNLGLREQILFPEVDYKTIDRLRGLQITINTSAKNREQGKRLLELLGMPFAKAQ
ncbi:MAG TPA: 50S ribosomal protein L5 [Patescibacteria group bacterium]|nr:50S ribosomal protein L5 [Patescibacteria group bacterium]